MVNVKVHHLHHCGLGYWFVKCIFATQSLEYVFRQKAPGWEFEPAWSWLRFKMTELNNLKTKRARDTRRAVFYNT